MESQVFEPVYRPRLAVTLGDPAGVGPEVVLKALSVRNWAASAEVTLIGNVKALTAFIAHMQEMLGVEETSWLTLPDWLQLLDIPLAQPAAFLWGQGTAASGAASFAFLQAAIAQTVAGNFDGIVTAPISKSAWKAAGHYYPGQTELLAEGANCDRFAMAFVAQSPYTSWRLRTLLATTHIPLAQVHQVLNPTLMSHKLELLIEALQHDFGVRQPRIAISGLNPHSGEGGQLGHEEQTWLIPWLQQQRQRFPEVTLDGPIPPDTMWVSPAQAWFGPNPPPNTHDAYLALYHDQGLIPTKLMGFDRAVNTTLGLPFIRTSPDHGTAFDIAGKGIADPTSLIHALEVAITLVKQRRRAAAKNYQEARNRAHTV